MAYKKFTASEDMLKPDPRFNSKLVSKFINCLMWDGKKTVAQKVFYGAMDQVAKKVNKRRQQSLAFRWILAACREAGGRPMADRLADELMAAFKKEGKAMTTREQTHRMADANKAFAHFAW